ncbi:hypothetical protein pipiens_000992, partial [Culex pipiens pipiens]
DSANGRRTPSTWRTRWTTRWNRCSRPYWVLPVKTNPVGSVRSTSRRK